MAQTYSLRKFFIKPHEIEKYLARKGLFHQVKEGAKAKKIKEQVKKNKQLLLGVNGS